MDSDAIMMMNFGIVKVTRARSYAGRALPDGLVRIHFLYGAMIYNPKLGEWVKTIKDVYR
jgi:hypothetical protein